MFEYCSSPTNGVVPNAPGVWSDAQVSGWKRKWAGNIHKRARFGMEVATDITSAIGGDKLGCKLSPWSSFQGMRMADPVPQFLELKGLKVGYLRVVGSRVNSKVDVENMESYRVCMGYLGLDIARFWSLVGSVRIPQKVQLIVISKQQCRSCVWGKLSRRPRSTISHPARS